MIADIASGNAGTADVFFLIAAILAAVAVVRPLMTQAWDGLFVPAALCALAIAWLVL